MQQFVIRSISHLSIPYNFLACFGKAMKRAATSSVDSAEWCTKSRRSGSPNSASYAGDAIEAPTAKIERMQVSAPQPEAATTSSGPESWNAQCRSHEEQIKRRLAKAKANAIHWRRKFEIERMQLAAFINGEEHNKHLPKIYGKDGVTVVGHLDPDPDIDRLHIKVWPGGNLFRSHTRYICFLDAKNEDTIAMLKAKIEDHPEGIEKPSEVFFSGVQLNDSDTLQHAADTHIGDDCILHVCTSQHVDVVAEASSKLWHWQLIAQSEFPDLHH
jgi:hypothetical protein